MKKKNKFGNILGSLSYLSHQGFFSHHNAESALIVTFLCDIYLHFNWLWLCRISNTATVCVHHACEEATHPTPTSWSTSLSRKTGWSWPWTPVVGGLWWSHWAGSWHPQSGQKHWQPADPRRWWRRQREPRTSWRGFAGSDQSEGERIEDRIINFFNCVTVAYEHSRETNLRLKIKMRLIIFI